METTHMHYFTGGLHKGIFMIKIMLMMVLSNNFYPLYKMLTQINNVCRLKIKLTICIPSLHKSGVESSGVKVTAAP